MEGTISGGTQRRLNKGDIVFTEITSNYQGYYTQLCCPISLGGKLPDSFKKLLEIEAMYRLAYEELRPGNTVSAIDAKVAKLAAESFFKLDTEHECMMLDLEPARQAHSITGPAGASTFARRCRPLREVP